MDDKGITAANGLYHWQDFTPDAEGVLVLPHQAEFAYSDGDAAEQYVIDSLRATADRRVASDALRARIIDWPSRYHLSPERANLLRHLDIGADAEILEVGAGCGAITRFLGETGARVTAVEGSRRRALAARLRCADLPQVRVVSSNAMAIAPTASFDWVLLIGVLEYAAIYVDAPAPHRALLERARAFLKPGGRLVVAIENRLGLKYFAGCREDHLNVLFAGIEDRYGPRTVRTFGRTELAQLLAEAGFPDVRFQYPYPDYKLPRLLLSEAGVQAPDFAAAELVRTTEFEDYGGGRQPVIDEFLALPAIGANRLLGELSNSFLVIASATPAGRLADEDFLALNYATGRSLQLASVTRFAREADGAVRAHKQPLSSHPQSGPLTAVPENTRYVPAPTLHSALLRQLKCNDLPGCRASWARYDDRLRQQPVSFESGPLGLQVMPGRFFDLTPRNLLATPERLIDIDDEWRVDFEIPRSTPALRYLRFAPELAPLPTQLGAADAVGVLAQLTPIALPTLDAADPEIERLVTELLIEAAYPFYVRDDAARDQDKSARLFEVAQRALDAQQPRVAARLLAYGFFVLRDWRLANDAALVSVLLGLPQEGLRLYFAAALRCPQHLDVLCERLTDFIDAAALEAEAIAAIWSAEPWAERLGAQAAARIAAALGLADAQPSPLVMENSHP